MRVRRWKRHRGIRAELGSTVRLLTVQITERGAALRVCLDSQKTQAGKILFKVV